MTKVTYLPLSARRALDNENKFLPTNLKHKITEMPGRTFVAPAPAVDPTELLLAKIATLEAQIKANAKDAENAGGDQARPVPGSAKNGKADKITKDEDI